MTTHVTTFLSKLDGSSITAVLVRGATGAFTVSIFSIAISFMNQVFLARFMGIENFGTFTYIATWISLLAIPALLGFTTGSVRFISKYYAQEEWALLKGFLRITSVLPTAAALIIGIITLAVVYLFSDSDSLQSSWFAWLIAALLLLPFHVLLTVQACSLRGLKKAALAETPTLLYSIGMLIVILLYSIFTIDLLDSATVMLMRSVVTAIAFIVLMLFLHRSLPAMIATVKPAYQTKAWLRVSLPLLLISGMSILLKRTDIIMLGIFAGTTEAGIYAVASRIADFTLLSFAAVTAIAAPMMSESFTANKHEQLQQVVRVSARGMFAITFISCSAIVLFLQQILQLFGVEFLAGNTAIFILLGTHLVNSFAGPVAQLLIMTGRQDDAAWILSANVILNIILNAVLIPLYGMSGAAVATGVSLAVATAMSVWHVYHVMGIRSTAI